MVNGFAISRAFSAPPAAAAQFARKLAISADYSKLPPKEADSVWWQAFGGSPLCRATLCPRHVPTSGRDGATRPLLTSHGLAPPDRLTRYCGDDLPLRAYPFHQYYGAAHPSRVHRYFRPRGYGHLSLFSWHHRIGSNVPEDAR
jgi:hypothetical protein